MLEVKILLVGKHDLLSDKSGLHAHSTVTLIKAEKNIIVDTGSFMDKNNLIQSLEKEGLKPEDIDIVILTHLHLDHSSNTNLFFNAKVYVKHNLSSGPGLCFEESSYLIKKVDLDNYEIVKGVKTILTPGHVDAHISVIVETEGGIITIAGDAIASKEYADFNKKPSKAYDFEEYLKSKKKILEIADFIIPGHGEIFKVIK